MAPDAPDQELDAGSDDMHQRSTEADKTCDVPVVDLWGVDGARRSLVTDHIRQASEEWGVFQVINHGVPGDLLTAMLQQAKEFFQLPVEKCKLVNDQTNLQIVLVQGYSSKEYGKSFLQWGEQLRHIISPASERNYALWPTNPPSFRETEEAYVTELEKFAKHIMELVAESLGLHKSTITEVFEENYERTLVTNHYPPCPDRSGSEGLIEHSDFSILTVLLHDTPGLEVLTKDGRWRHVESIRGALVVNLGDQMQVLSNGKYQSPVHRAVVDSEGRRVSVNAFTNPAAETLVAPISALISQSQPPLYQGHTYGAYKAAFGSRWKEKRAFLKSGSWPPFEVGVSTGSYY